MSTKIASVMAAIVLLGSLAIGVDAPAQEATSKGESIQQLVQNLGSNDFRAREAAMAELEKLDDAVPALHKATSSKDPEVVDRAQQLIEAFYKRRAEKTLWDIAAGNEIILDQFVDEMVLARKTIWVRCWPTVLEYARKVSAQAARDAQVDFLFPATVDRKKGEQNHTTVDELRGNFVVGDRILARSVIVRQFGSCLLLCGGALEVPGGLSDSVVLVNGNVRSGGFTSHSVIFCDGDVTTNVIHDCVIFATGDVHINGMMDDCVIRCGGKVEKTRQTFNSTISMHEKKLLPLGRLFQTTQAGVEVRCSAAGGLRVNAVVNGKPFAKGGIRPGDEILAIDQNKVSALEWFRRHVRRKYLARTSMTLSVRRQGKVLSIPIQF
jgi:hypothetical protein